MGIDSSQRKGKRAKLIYVAVFHGMTESFWPESFQCGYHPKKRPE
jgi:hypothetical protein